MSSDGGKSKNTWKKEVKEEQGYICLVCNQKGTDKTLNIHHKKPKSRKGGNSRGNVVAWHVWCHQQYHKVWGNRTSDDFGNPV